MKEMYLNTAILLAIKSYGDTPFSMYDITLKIREDVNNGDYELKEYGTEVLHSEVKEFFLDLINNNLMELSTDYDPMNGYREFTNKKDNTPTVTVIPKTPSPTPVNLSPAPKTPKTCSIPTDVQVKIYKYLKGNGPTKIKSIQSRLKGYPYTCKDIKEFLNKINLIDPATANAPASLTYTVSFK